MADTGPARNSPLALHSSTPQELIERLEAERSEMAHLVYRDSAGNQVIRLLPSTAETVTIGRDVECFISLHWDPEVSGTHALLERHGRQWTVTDDGLSLNGTFVNSKRVQARQRLRDLDILSLGRTTIAFRSPGHAHGMTTRPGAPSAVAVVIGEKDRQVLVALARPLLEAPHALPATNKAISDEVHLSIPAVKKRLGVLFNRFELSHLPQAEKRTRLAFEALQRGIVREGDL